MSLPRSASAGGRGPGPGPLGPAWGGLGGGGTTDALPSAGLGLRPPRSPALVCRHGPREPTHSSRAGCLSPRPPRLRRAHRGQPGHRRHPLLEQELGQGRGVRDLPAPEPGPHHARLPDLPPGLVSAGEGVAGGGGARACSHTVDVALAGGSRGSRNKAPGCRGPGVRLTQEAARRAAHASRPPPPVHAAARPGPGTRPRPRACHTPCHVALPRFPH